MRTSTEYEREAGLLCFAFELRRCRLGIRVMSPVCDCFCRQCVVGLVIRDVATRRQVAQKEYHGSALIL